MERDGGGGRKADDSAVFVISLHLPPKEVSQNFRRGGHWAHKRNAVRAYREAAHSAALERGLPPTAPWRECLVSFAFYFPRDRRKRDLLNYVAACKPAIDGLVDAGLMIDDSLIVGGGYKVVVPHDCDPMVVIEVEQCRFGENPARQSRADGGPGEKGSPIAGVSAGIGEQKEVI